MHTFEFRGHPVRYVRQGKGEPVVLIHNGGTSHAIWRDVLPGLAGRYEVFALDLPGFGASPKPGTGFDLGNFINLLEAFVDTHRLAPVRLVGNCMGSAMALGLAMRRPEAVRGMVLINPLTDATYTAGRLGWTLWLRKHAPMLSHALYARLGRLTLPQFVGTQALAFQFGRTGRTKNLYQAAELRACFTREGQMDSLLMVLDDVMNYSVFDSLESGTHLPPICTVWGLENRVLSAKAGRRLNEKLKPTQQEWLEGCGHLAMMERPDKVVSIAQEFFSKKCIDRT